ncbi:hypothetical protein FACS189487_03300 [Campylobacterota bacterium]|nr:hypothetical protein FACS189487_03300 [Campylobacterota bacterium]
MENKEPKILTDNAKEGDIYYFELKGRYYFLQIVKINTRTKETQLYGQKRVYDYFIVVFEKSYKKISDDIKEMNFVDIYQIKYKPKNTLLYIACEYDEPELKIGWWDIMYKDKDILALNYWGNETPKNEYNPKIIIGDVSYTENDKNILISSTGSNIGYIFDRILQDIKYKNKKSATITPRYFHKWLDEIDADIIIKMEKILTNYENNFDKENAEKLLKKCILNINKLDEKEHFIGTIESENIFDKIIEINKKYNLDENVIEKIIEENRGW